jgi:hypothetical protein
MIEPVVITLMWGSNDESWMFTEGGESISKKGISLKTDWIISSK